jgi:hypothetical protein
MPKTLISPPSLRDALDPAILMKEEARALLEFADQMEIHHTPEAAGFFRSMAENEAKHGQAVERDRPPSPPARVDRGMLWDVEAPDYDGAGFRVPAGDGSGPGRRGQGPRLLPAGPAPPQGRGGQELFEELREEERQHQALVLAQLAKLPVGPEANPDDYADEPVGH